MMYNKSKVQTDKDVFTRFYLVHRVCWCLGLCPFTLIRCQEGYRFARLSKRYLYITSAFGSAVLIYLLFTLINGIKYMPPSPILSFVAAVFLCSNFVHITCVIVCNKLYCRRMISLLNRLYHVESQLKAIGCNFKDDFSKYIFPICFLVEVLCVVVVQIWLIYIIETRGGNILKHLVFSCLVLVHCAADLQILTFIQTLTHLFSRLNSFLENHFLRQQLRSVVAQDSIGVVMLLHQKLCRLAKDYSKANSLPLLTCFCYYFCVLLMQVFCVVIFIKRRVWNDYHTVVIGTCVTLPCLVKLTNYILASSRCMRQPKQTKEIISKVKCPLLRQEFSAFSLQILHEEFTISAAGFFTIEYSLGLSILASLMLYVIILVQFGMKMSVYDLLTD